MIASEQRAGRLKSRFRRILVALDSTPESLLSVDGIVTLIAFQRCRGTFSLRGRHV
jgi:hypothetical protein